VSVGGADGEAVGESVGVAVDVSVDVGCWAGAAPGPIAAGRRADALERGRCALSSAMDGGMDGAEAPRARAIPPFSDIL